VGVTVSDELYSFIFRSVKLSWTTLKMVLEGFSETSVSLKTNIYIYREREREREREGERERVPKKCIHILRDVIYVKYVYIFWHHLYIYIYMYIGCQKNVYAF